MKAYSQNCLLCRLMRSLAFTSLGMGVGMAVAYLFGASKENMMLSGLFVAAVLVFGWMGRKPRD